MTEEQITRQLLFSKREGLVMASAIIKKQGIEKLDSVIENWKFNGFLEDNTLEDILSDNKNTDAKETDSNTSN